MTKFSLRVLIFSLVLMPMLVIGQYGPMGIGNADGSESPAGYAQPRLLLWLDGSEVERTGTQVTQWTDQSGNGHHFTPDAAVNQPTFYASGGPGLGVGTPYLSFDGDQNRLVCSNFSFPSSGYSIYFVIKSTDDKYGMFNYATATDPHEVNIYNDNGFRQQAGAAYDRSSNIGNINGTIWNYGGIWWNNTSNILWEYNRSNGAGGENPEVFADGFNISPSGTAVIGDIQNSVNGGYISGDAFEGQIAEIIIWEGTLTKPMARMMRTYMHTKYGIDANGSNWDKFQGYASGSAGEYDEPIGVGRDGATHSESRSQGLVLRVNTGEWSQSMTYLCAGSDGALNASVSTNLPAGVQARWNRTWEINGAGGTSQRYRIGFDFSEGITNGETPQGVENFVLLRRTGKSGAFTAMPESEIVETAIVANEVVFTVLKSHINTTNTYYTIGTKNVDDSSLDGSDQKTWYAYQSGNWGNYETWTLDGSAAPAHVNPEDAIPSTGDNIYIGSGRTVTVSGSLPTHGSLKVFGTLDVGSAPAPIFISIAGSGLIRCAGNGSAGNFPIGASTAFADAVNGGTVEFYGSGGFTQSTEVVVNKLKIDFATSGSKMTLSANLTHNGFFEINKGTLEINNSGSPCTIKSNGHVLVENPGRISVASTGTAQKHSWNFEKDFINDGDVRFTTRTSPVYTSAETKQFIEARFISGTSNQELGSNGSTTLSRLVINKGTDMTYVLSISGIPDSEFNLYGPCNSTMGGSSYTAENSFHNSFALINGTVEIKEGIFIPIHHNSGNYNINRTAMLWINGGEVTKGFPSGNQAIVVYGAVKLSAGTANANCTSGFTIRDNGLLQVDGGVMYANQIRTSNQGTQHIGGIIINGGKVYVDGTKGVSSVYYTFSLTYPGNLFRMTGGELHIKGPSSRGLVFINSDPANTSVSGGTVFLDIANHSANHKISSRADFWNLTITRSADSGANQPVFVKGGESGSGSERDTVSDQNLVVRNNLAIIGSKNPRLQMGQGSFIADLYLHKDLTIGDGCTYDHFSNTTHFIGNVNSSLTFYGSTKLFNNVIVNKASDTRYVTIQNEGDDPVMDVLGNLNLENGYFDNDKRNVYVRGNIVNRSVFGSETSTGHIRMKGETGQQKIISDNGIFHKLVIDNPDNVALENDGLTIKTFLELQNGSFLIGDNKLRFDTEDPYEAFAPGEFIVCSGNASAGGVEILNSVANQEMEYKFGVSTGSGQKYTPAFVNINSGFDDEGYIRITPVDTVMPTSDVSVGTEDYLNYYWRVTHSEYINTPKITHRFQYHGDDVRGDQPAWLSGRVLMELPFERSVDDMSTPASNHIDIASNIIYYNGTDVSNSFSGTGTKLVNADYSAGSEDRFSGSPKVFYSRNNAVDAEWEVPNNWNELSAFGSTATVLNFHSSDGLPQNEYDEFPKAGDIAIIGFDVSDPHRKPHVYKAPSTGIKASVVGFSPMEVPRYMQPGPGNLGILRPTLKLSSVNDIAKVQQITGEGALWLTGDVDLGVTDIGGFLNENSSVVVIGAGGVFNYLPSNLPNLFIASGSPTIANDVTIRGDLEIAGSSQLFLSTTYNGNIQVNGDLILDKFQSGSSNSKLHFRTGKNHKTVSVKGDLKILGSGSIIDISTAPIQPGTPTEWTPENSDALLWFDAAEGNSVTTSGGKVTTWKNRASSSHYATQAIGDNQPSYQASSALNGKHTIRFDGGNDFLSIPDHDDLNIPANQNFEIFTVIMQSSDAKNAAIYAKGDAGLKDFLLFLSNSRQYRLRLGGANMDLHTPTNMQGYANMGWGRRQGNTAVMYNTKGGNQTRANVGERELNNTSDVTIGAAKNGEARYFKGDIAEIIFIKRALNTAERQQMEGYLAHKWNLQGDLPAGHPYKSYSPMIGGQPSDLPNQLIVEGNIVQSTTSTSGLDLHEVTGIYPVQDTSFVNLILRGSENHAYSKVGAGGTPKLWKLEVDKGIDLNSGFTFNTNVNIDGPTNEPEKSVELKNGLLKLNDPNLNITFSSGGGDFVIPPTAGLELNQGNYKITGMETGLLLEGLLKITNANFKIGEDEGENNYIEYSSSAKSIIHIEGGSLEVGSQIRRGLTNTGGILKYEQTGGVVEIGKFSAPATNRGMLEIVNAGSSFKHSGGKITFVRGVSSTSTPSLLIEPQLAGSIASGNSKIFIGNTLTPSGAEIQNFGIKSSIPLNELSIRNNAEESDPIVNLISRGLELKGNLNIDLGARFNCGNQDLTLHKDVINNGVLSSTSSLITLNHEVLGAVEGSGTFDLYDLERKGGSGGLTTVAEDLLVKNDFTLDGGTIDFSSNTLTVKGDVIADGEIRFTETSHGLIFTGGTEQKLRRSVIGGTTRINSITIANSNGVTMNAGSGQRIVMDKRLRLSQGVFDLQGNLLELELDAIIDEINPFGENNMISTGGGLSNHGVKKHIIANSAEDIFIPLGIDRFMPVQLDFSNGGSSGATNSSFLIKLNKPQIAVVNSIDNGEDNVLGMYFTVVPSDVGSGLNMQLQLQYHEDYVNVQPLKTEADYIGAKAYKENEEYKVFKYGTEAVDEVNHIISLSISTNNSAGIYGDYFAGVSEFIPEKVPIYRTTGDGEVDDPVYNPAVDGGEAPSGAVVIVREGHTLIFDRDRINFYRTEIEEGAVLKIDRTSFHRLGTVTGKGTIHLVGTGTMPSGEYDIFFDPECDGGKLIFEGENGDDFEILSNQAIVRKVDIIGDAGSTIRFSNNDVTICEDLTIDNDLTTGPQVRGADGTQLTVKWDLKIERGSFNMGQGDLLVEGDLNLSNGGVNGGSLSSGNMGTTTIEGDMFLGGEFLNLGTSFRVTEVKGNIEKTAGTITGGTGGARLKMSGTESQYIHGVFEGDSKIPNLHIANPEGISLYNNVEVSDVLRLEKGLLNTGVDSLIILTLDNTDVEPEGGTPTSFVNGPMRWKINSGISQRIFPIGKNDRYRPLQLTERSVQRDWEVEYYDTVATVQNDVHSLDPNPNSVPAIKTVSIQEHWRIDSRVADPTSAKVSLSWGDSSAVAPGEGDFSSLLVLSYNSFSDEWDSYKGVGHYYDSGLKTGRFFSENLVSFSANFSERFFTLGSSDGINPLPVTWLHFQGQTRNDAHILTWATASEQNNDYFELERSIDTKNWMPVAKITGAGYSHEQLEYTYTDRDAPYGRVYYRIRQVDFDGRNEIYPNLVTLERKLVANVSKMDFVLYPNPTNSQRARIMLPGYEDAVVNVSLSDMSGKVLSQEMVQIDGQGISNYIHCNFQPGIYLVTVIADGKMRSRPLVITK